MDFSKFSDAEFDAKEWVNSALRAHKDANVPVDAHASTLVMKLQLFIQEVNSALEDTSMQVVQGLPRVMRDVEAVRQEAALLKEQMHIVKEDIKRVERETAQSMQQLVEIDTIKTRMRDAQNALQEADNWTTLSADVQDVFASQDVHKIAEKLIGMQQSLNVLHDVPDYEDRKKLLESLKNRLEALLSPRLVAAFNAHSLEEAQEYVRVFTGIERYPQLRNYFIGCHKAVIVQMWSRIHDPAKPFLEYLSSFYDELLVYWETEYAWTSLVFPGPIPLLCLLFIQSLDSLSPPLDQCLQAAMQGKEGPLQVLMEARQVSLRFIKGLEAALSRASVSSPPPPCLFSLVESVHVPFCQLLVRYPRLEEQHLTSTLKDLELPTVGTDDVITSLSSSVPIVFRTSSEAMKRCERLTEGWGTAGNIRALEAFFSQYFSKMSSTIRTLRCTCGLDAPVEEGEGVKGEEWTHLQVAFALIQCCGELLLRTDQLNSQLCSALTARSASLQNPADPSNPFGLFDYLLVYHPEEHTATMEILTAVEKGGRDFSLLMSTNRQIHSINAQAHTFAFDLLFSKLRQKLSTFPKLKIWETGVITPLESPRALTDDLPSFSLSPLPYITEVGDYLLTLPQQLDPFTSQENRSLTVALKHGRLPFPPSEGSSGARKEEEREGEEEEEEEHPSDAWLGAVARGTIKTYTSNILQIPSLSPQGAFQLATDISYLCNVLAALGQSPTQELSQLETLIKADRETFLGYQTDESILKQLFNTVARVRTWQD